MKNKKTEKLKKGEKNSKKLIKKSMTFAEIMNKHPELGGELFKRGMHCFGCAMAGGETLEQGAMAHGINPDKLIAELNRKLK